MNRIPDSDLTVTIIGLWSAMLGGAVGAATGRLSDLMLCNTITGFVTGFVVSVLIYLPMMGIGQGIALLVMNRDIEGRPIGCVTSDRFSAILGGIAGSIGALVVAAVPPTYELRDPYAFTICWTVAAFVPIIVGFALVQHSRWKNRS